MKEPETYPPRRAAALRAGRVVSGAWVMMILVGLLLSSVMARAESHAVIDMQGKTCTDYGCHADLQKKAILHGPVAKGICHSCHVQPQPDVHGFQASHAQEALCQSCHTLVLKNHVRRRRVVAVSAMILMARTSPDSCWTGSANYARPATMPSRN